MLDSWIRDGWIPDIVVIDYADVLAPPSGVREFREQQFITWMGMRTLSMDLQCLLLTATQADAASYKQWLLTRSNFSEDKRKLGQVSSILGMNVTALEYDKQLMRLNWVLNRDMKASRTRCLHVATCLALGQPIVHSTF